VACVLRWRFSICGSSGILYMLGHSNLRIQYSMEPNRTPAGGACSVLYVVSDWSATCTHACAFPVCASWEHGAGAATAEEGEAHSALRRPLRPWTSTKAAATMITHTMGGMAEGRAALACSRTSCVGLRHRCMSISITRYSGRHEGQGPSARRAGASKGAHPHNRGNTKPLRCIGLHTFTRALRHEPQGETGSPTADSLATAPPHRLGHHMSQPVPMKAGIFTQPLLVAVLVEVYPRLNKEAYGACHEGPSWALGAALLAARTDPSSKHGHHSGMCYPCTLSTPCPLHSDEHCLLQQGLRATPSQTELK
jgi:hypothetical protein